jgi:hypothetical protein
MSVVSVAFGAFLCVVGTSAVAFAGDKQNVRPSSTVEVLDDKAQIDDVISKMKDLPPPAPAKEELKHDRPQLPPAEKDQKGESKSSPLRKPHHERGSGASERTERHHRR